MSKSVEKCRKMSKIILRDHPAQHLVPYRLTAALDFPGRHHHGLTVMGIRDQLLAPPPAIIDIVLDRFQPKVTTQFSLKVQKSHFGVFRAILGTINY